MENTELHGQKLAILSRLIKESSLTLEEALVLLQDEPDEELEINTTSQPHWNPWHNPIQPSLGQPWTSSGSGSIPPGAIRFTNSLGGGIGFGTTTATQFPINTTADADLNN